MCSHNRRHKEVNILMAIQWVQHLWKDVSLPTVKRYFDGCCFSKCDDD